MKTPAVIRIGLRAACVVLALLAATSMAATDDKKIARAQQERIQRLQQEQQAMQQEKTQLSTEKDDIERKLQEAKSDLERARALVRKDSARQLQLDAAQKEKEAAAAQLTEQLAAQVAALNSDLAAARQQLQTTQQTVVQLKQSQADGQRELELQKTALQSCEKQNLGLYQLNTDLLARYESAATQQSKGLLGGLLNPFGQVRVENEGSTYRDQLDTLRRDAASAQ
jgi:DNA repair exonuclease SbcCD ATPase subunit